MKPLGRATETGDRELRSLTTTEAMQALAPAAAEAFRRDATPEFRDLLDARPDPEEA
jgi:hypothetical protein